LQSWPFSISVLYTYLDAAGHGHDLSGPLFRPVKNPITGTLAKPLNPTSVYQDVVRRYGEQVGINAAVRGFCVHSLPPYARRRRQTPWNTTPICQGPGVLGHANVSITWMYDKRKNRPEDSPTFRMDY